MANSVLVFYLREQVIVLVSMLPIVESRGAIPLGILYCHLNPRMAYLLAALGNVMPVPFILLPTRPVFAWFKKTRHFARPVNRLHNRAFKKSEKVTKYETLGLFLFVAVPFPGAGAWPGSLIASVINMRFKHAVPSVIFGGAAGLLMAFGSSIIDFIIGLFV